MAKEVLSEKRFTHSLNVAKAAQELAEFNHCDIEKAYIAGLLHDITKELPIEEQLKLLQIGNIELTEAEKASPALWHSTTAAVYAKENLGIEDEDILNAIRYHTSGRAGMSILEKVIYLADSISEERHYHDVDEVRAAAKRNLNEGVMRKLKFAINALTAKDRPICSNTIDAYNELILKQNNERTK